MNDDTPKLVTQAVFWGNQCLQVSIFYRALLQIVALNINSLHDLLSLMALKRAAGKNIYLLSTAILVCSDFKKAFSRKK